MNKYELVKINKNNISILKRFLELAGDSLVNFRYFQSRPLNVIENHIVTYIILNDMNIPVCYGHLDKENDRVWLGIAVIAEQRGNGYGNLMMNELILMAKNLKLKEIHLSVDFNNNKAIKLYEKFGFKCIKTLEFSFIYKLYFNI